MFGLAAVLLLPAFAFAHPLGNSSITHFGVLAVLPDRVELDYLLDIAENPAAVVRRDEIDTDRNDEDTTDEQKAWLERKAVELAPLLHVKLDGSPLPIRAVSGGPDAGAVQPGTTRLVIKLPGVAGMPTYRIIVRYVAAFAAPLAGGHTLTYEDRTYANQPGMRRILLQRTPQVEINPPRPAFWDEGDDPFIYEQYDPGNLPQERSATIRFRVALPPLAQGGPGGVSPAHTPPLAKGGAGGVSTQPAEFTPPNAQAQKSPPMGIVGSFTDPRNNPAQTAKYYRQADRLINLLRGRWGLMVLLTITALSFGWGAAHALMPGHTKTVVAAYLISQHGTYRHAVLLALIVTLTHTALVVIMGLVIWAYQATHPQLGPRIQLWLGTTAGVLVAFMGLTLIWRAFRGQVGHHHHEHAHPAWPSLAHEHEHGHDHAGAVGDSSASASGEQHHAHHHGAHHHDHDHQHHHHGPSAPGGARPDQLTTRMLLVMGITGGIVPCPTATLIMLTGIGTNLVAGALYAVGVFSLGLALTLMAIGFLALSSRRFATRLLTDREHEHELTGSGRAILLQVVPALSGLVVVALGAAITAHYLYMIRTGGTLFSWLS